jgi:hypothetical protein
MIDRSLVGEVLAGLSYWSTLLTEPSYKMRLICTFRNTKTRS